MATMPGMNGDVYFGDPNEDKLPNWREHVDPDTPSIHVLHRTGGILFMASEPTPDSPERGVLETFLSETAIDGGNPYPGVEAIEAAEGPDWWKLASEDEDADPLDD